MFTGHVCQIMAMGNVVKLLNHDYGTVFQISQSLVRECLSNSSSMATGNVVHITQSRDQTNNGPHWSGMH